MTHHLKLILASTLAIGLVFILISKIGPRDQEKMIVVQDMSYVEVSRDEMIDSADAIFVGKVISISPTHWNQDNGEEWNDDAIGGDSGLQIHTIEVEIIRPIVDTIKLEKRITITVLGSSPIEGYADHNLKESAQAVFFVRQTELAWRGGETRLVFEFIGAPVYSYYLRESDGMYHDGRPNAQALSLDGIIKLIAQRRADLIQP